MVFRNIIEAIQYAQQTGEMEPLQKYCAAHLENAARRIMPALSVPMRGDDIYFLLAYAETLAELHRASLSPDEQRLVDAIKKDVNISLVKVMMPNGLRGGDGA